MWNEAAPRGQTKNGSDKNHDADKPGLNLETSYALAKHLETSPGTLAHVPSYESKNHQTHAFGALQNLCE